MVEVGVFQWGLGHFKFKFQVEGDITHQPLLVSKIRVSALSCGIKISAICSFISSQSTRVTDRRPDVKIRQSYS